MAVSVAIPNSNAYANSATSAGPGLDPDPDSANSVGGADPEYWSFVGQRTPVSELYSRWPAAGHAAANPVGIPTTADPAANPVGIPAAADPAAAIHVDFPISANPSEASAAADTEPDGTVNTVNTVNTGETGGGDKDPTTLGRVR